MNRITLLLAAALGASTLPALAQNVPPTVTNPIADFTVYAATPARSIDLATVFADPDVSNAVRMTTSGVFRHRLFGSKSRSRRDFLNYLAEGRYLS